MLQNQGVRKPGVFNRLDPKPDTRKQIWGLGLVTSGLRVLGLGGSWNFQGAFGLYGIVPISGPLADVFIIGFLVNQSLGDATRLLNTQTLAVFP